jgi:hypothetical protein
MSFLNKAKSNKGGPVEIAYERHEEAIAAAEMQERRGNVVQAVRVRLWNGLPQRIAHRPAVLKWCNSKLANHYPPPPVPSWIEERYRDETEEAEIDRAMWLLQRGRVTPQQVAAWPKRWRDIGATRGYLDADGALRFGKEGAQ